MGKASFSKKIATTQIQRKPKAIKWVVALKPGESLDLDSEAITIVASRDNSGIVYVGETKQGWVAKSKGIGNSITVSNVSMVGKEKMKLESGTEVKPL